MTNFCLLAIRKLLYASVIFIVSMNVVIEKARGPNQDQMNLIEKFSFAFEDDSDFVKLKKGEARPEPPQSFEDYVESNPVRLTEKRNKIVIQPLGKLPENKKELMKKLAEFVGLYFVCDVQLAPERELPENHFRLRKTFDGKNSWRQYQTGFILNNILKPKLPEDAVCYFGVTMEDLYPDESWNYVFGQASLSERVAVFSLCRYFADFWKGQGITSDSYIGASEKLSTYRSMGVITHEIGHVFGLHHCQYYRCNMCYANSLDELDRYPVHLCPVCLKKLCWNRGFDILDRYKKLEKFYRSNGFEEEADWAAQRIMKMNK